MIADRIQAVADHSHKDFGGVLRREREDRGISLREIASNTKISVSSLEALERNQIARLPGGVFTRAFVRSYAVQVGLDPERTVRDFLMAFPDVQRPETAATIDGDIAAQTRQAWRGWSMVLGVVLLIGLIAAKVYLGRG